MSRRQPHPDPLHQRARQLYSRHGITYASQATAIPTRTIRRWARAEQWPRQPATGHQPDQRLHLVPAQAQPAVTKTVRPLPVSRPRLAARIRRELDALLDELEAYRQAKRPRDARDCAITLGILTDKWLALEQRDQGLGASPLDPASQVAALEELVTIVSEREAGGA